MRLAGRRIYYGWVIVAGLLCSSAVITAMGGVNSGQFIKPMTEELGIGQTWFGWAQTARLLTFAGSSWVIGRVIDSRGARLPMVGAGLVMGLVLVGLSQASEGWHVVALFGIAGLTGLQGAGGNLYNSVPLSRWFVRKRGRAMSIAFLGTPIGIFIFAPMTQWLIDTRGWREAWLALAVIGPLVISVVALGVIRRAPEDLGLLPDGDEALSPEAGSPSRPAGGASSECSFTRAEAVRTPTFRWLAAVDGLRQVAVATLGLFRIPFYVDQGIDPTVVALALSAEALVGMMITVPVGWLVDRLQPRYVSASATAVMVATFGATIMVSSPAHVFVATILYGVSAVTFAVSQQVIWPHYFGGLHVGQIRGLSMFVGISLAAFGAPATGMVRDATGSFVPAWLVAMALLVIATVVLVRLPSPARAREEALVPAGR